MNTENKDIISPDFSIFNAKNPQNNLPVLVIGMKDIDYDVQLDILSYLRKKEYSIKIDRNILLLELEDSIYIFDFQTKEITLPNNGITIVFDFIQENGKMDQGVKTLIEIVQ